MHSVPQDIANERDSDHKTNQQHEYVDYNVSALNHRNDTSVQGAP